MASPKNRGSAYITIDAERCKGCSLCISVCPRKIIGLANHINQSGQNPATVIEGKGSECTGCAVCAIMCPDVAISVFRRDNAPASKPGSHQNFAE